MIVDSFFIVNCVSKIYATDGTVDASKAKSHSKTRPRGYKTLFMLSLVEHEILNAHKYKKKYKKKLLF